MSKKSFVDILVGVDGQTSAQNIYQELSQSLDQILKPIMISLELDPASITNIKQSIESLTRDFEVRIANIQPTQIKQDSQAETPVTGIDLSEQFADPANMERITKFLKEQNIQFKGMQIAISNATQDVDGFVRATLRLNETDSLIRNITIGLDHLGEGGNIQVLGSTLQNNFNKILEGSIQKLRQTSDEIMKLQQKEKMGTNTLNDEAAKIALNNKLFEQQTAIMAQVNAAREQGLILTSEQAAIFSRIQTLVNKTENQEVANLEIAKRNELNAQLKEYERLIQQVYKLKTNPPVEKEAAEVAELIEQGEVRIQQLREQDYVFSGLIDKHKSLQALEKEKMQESEQIKNYKEAMVLLDQLAEKQTHLGKLSVEHARTSGRTDEVYNNQRMAKIELLKTQMNGLRDTFNALPAAGLPKVEERFNNIQKAAERVRYQLLAIESSTKNIDTTIGKVVTINNNAQSSNLIVPKSAIDAGIAGLERYTQLLHGADSSISNLRVSTKNVAGITHEFAVKQNLTANYLKISKYAYDANLQALRLMGEETRVNTGRLLAWSDQIGVAIKRMFAWGVAAQTLYGTLRKIKEGITFLIELDKNLTQVAVVQGTLRSSTKNLAGGYTTLAADMRKSVKEISEVNMELIRQGLTLEEATDRMKVILKLSSAALITTDQSLKLITSSVNAMHTSAERTADVMLKASMISASDVEGLADAFTKTASSAYAAGLKIEQVTAMLATMKETTQESDSNLGTSLKTILARFNRVNEETGEINEDLNDVQTAFESVGIQFRDSAGEIRNVFTLLEELNAIWPKLTKVQQAYVATQTAGVRMQNRFFAIISNFNKVMDIHNELMNAGGSLNQSYAIYLDSVEAAQKRLTVAIEKFWVEMLDSNRLKDFYNILAAIVEKANELGGINLLVGGGASAAFFASPMFKNTIKSWDTQKEIQRELVTLEEKKSGVTKEIEKINRQILITKEKSTKQLQIDLEGQNKLFNELEAEVKQKTEIAKQHGIILNSQDKIGKSTGKTALAFNAIKTTVKGIGVSLISMAGYAAAFAALSFVIAKGLQFVDNQMNKVKNQASELANISQQLQKDAEVGGLIAQLEKENELRAQGAENQATILSLQKQIAQVKPEWIDSFDPDTLEPMVSDTEAAKANMEEINKLTLEQYNLTKEQNENNLQNRKDSLRLAQGNILLMQEEIDALDVNTYDGFEEKLRLEEKIRKENESIKKLRGEILDIEQKLAQGKAAENLAVEAERKSILAYHLKAIKHQKEISENEKKTQAERDIALEKLKEHETTLLSLVGGQESYNFLIENGVTSIDNLIKASRQSISYVKSILDTNQSITQSKADQLRLILQQNKALAETAARERATYFAGRGESGEFLQEALRSDALYRQSQLDLYKTLEQLRALDNFNIISDDPKPSLNSGGGSGSSKDEAEYKTQLDELHSLLEKIAIKEKEIARFQAFKNFASEKEKEYLLTQENALLEEQIRLNQELEKEYSKLLNSSLDVARGLAAQYPKYLELDEVTKQVIVHQDALAKETNDKVKEAIENAALAVTKYRDALDDTQMSIVGFQKAQWDLATALIKEAIDDKISSLDAQIKSIEKSQDAQIERINKALEEQEKYYENQIKLKQEQIDLIDQQLEQEERLIALKDKTDELTKLQTDRRYTYITEMGQELYTFDRMQYDQLWREREELIRQYKNDDLKNALRKEIDDLNAARDRKKEIANKEIEDLKAANKARIDNLKAAQDALKELQNKGLADIQEGLDEFEAMFGKTVGGIEALAARIAAALAMLNKQPEPRGGGGSAKWSSDYGDPWAGGNNTGETFDLTDANGKSVTIPVLSDSYVNSVKDKMGVKYHDGGIVGGQSFNPQTEQVAKLLLGEVVLNEKHLENVPNILQDLSAAMVKKQFDASQISKLIPSAQANNSTEYHLHNVSINTNNANDFFKQIEHLVVAKTGY